MKIAHKLILSYLPMALLAGIVIALGVGSNERVQQPFARLAWHELPLISELRNMKFAGQRLVASAAGCGLITQSSISGPARQALLQHEAEEFQQARRLFDDSLARYQDAVARFFPAEKEHLESIVASSRALRGEGEALLSLILRGASDEKILKSKQRFDSSVDAFLRAVDAVLARQEDKVARRVDRVQNSIASARATLLAVGSLALATILLVGAVAVHAISRPIAELKQAVARVGRGELETRIAECTGDEVGDLARAFNEMTESLKRTRAESQSTQAQMRSIFEGMGEGLLVTDLHDVVQDANRRMEELCGYTLAEMRGRPAYEFLLRRDQWPALNGFNERRAQGHSDVYELELSRRDDTRFWALIHATPLRDAQGQVVGTIGAQIDITARKQAERALQESYDALEQSHQALRQSSAQLRESEERFRCLIEQAVDAVIVHDEEGQMLDANTRLCQSLGYTREQVLALSIRDFEANYDAEQVARGWKKLRVGDSMTVDGMHRRRDGSEFPVEVRVGLVEIDGRRILLALARDVTERKQAEAQVRASLKEKELLLKEVYHRVKNNMQVIISMLSLQSRSISDPILRAALVDSQERIRSMAMVHEQLYESPGLASIDFDAYGRNLTSNLFASYANELSGVRVLVSAQNVSLDVDMAIPCGLIVNELVSNAFKYAFPNRRNGEIGVNVSRDKGQLSLQVLDDGVGLPEGFDWRQSQTLGLQLVSSMTAQLDGELSVCSEPGAGTCWRITFPDAG